MWWAMMLAAQAQMPMKVDPMECEAMPAQVLIGQLYRRHVPTRARKLSGSSKVRVIFPGQVLGDEFRPERITVKVDYARRVSDVRWG